MCTCITYLNNDFYFGRNLDLDYSFNESVTITPRNYTFALKNGEIFKNTYALIGMATVYNEYPLYAEAINEKGLGMAGLNYPHHGMYPDPKDGMVNIAPFEFIPYILGQAATVKEALAILKNVWLDNVPYSKELPITVLHYMIADKDESIVIEHSEEGLKIYDNPFGVLTNNPSFPYHLENMKNYMHSYRIHFMPPFYPFTNKELGLIVTSTFTLKNEFLYNAAQFRDFHSSIVK